MIDGAKVSLASDRSLTNGSPITKEMLLPYLREWPSCPDGGTYSIGVLGAAPKCSNPAHQNYKVVPD